MPAIVVIVPLISGIALHFNINPYHLGIVFLINLEIGYLMPPMGLNLFIAGFRFGRPVPDLYKMVVPFIGVFIVALMITTYVPLRTPITLGMFHREAATSTTTGTPPPGGTVVAPTGDGGAAVELPSTDCDVPGEDEDPIDFEQRCHFDFNGDGTIGHGGGDGGATDAPSPNDATPATTGSDAGVAHDAAPHPDAPHTGG